MDTNNEQAPHPEDLRERFPIGFDPWARGHNMRTRWREGLDEAPKWAIVKRMPRPKDGPDWEFRLACWKCFRFLLDEHQRVKRSSSKRDQSIFWAAFAAERKGHARAVVLQYPMQIASRVVAGEAYLVGNDWSGSAFEAVYMYARERLDGGDSCIPHLDDLLRGCQGEAQAATASCDPTLPYPLKWFSLTPRKQEILMYVYKHGPVSRRGIADGICNGAVNSKFKQALADLHTAGLLDMGEKRGRTPAYKVARLPLGFPSPQ